jgi:hypothetical protein
MASRASSKIASNMLTAGSGKTYAHSGRPGTTILAATAATRIMLASRIMRRSR